MQTNEKKIQGGLGCMFIRGKKKKFVIFFYPSKRYNYCYEILLGGVKVQSIRRKMENLKRLRDSEGFCISFFFFLSSKLTV